MLWKKRVGFYSSNLDYYITHVKDGELRYLSLIFCVFSEKSGVHKTAAAKALKEILGELTLDGICEADIQMRERSSMEWSIDWRPLSIRDFLTDAMSDEEKRAVVVFASFNPSGYIREKAVRALMSCVAPLPFILLRTNDWVPQVRQTALDLLPEALSRASDEEIVYALPLMEKLRRSERCDYGTVLSMILNAFAGNGRLVKQGLESGDIRARRFCISCINDLTEIDRDCLKDRIVNEPDPFLRRMIFKVLSETGNDDAETVELSKAFLRDKNPPNRVSALLFLHSRLCGGSFDTAVYMLTDKSAQVRELSRYIVKQYKADYDIHAVYLNALNTNTAIGLYGLGECGLKDDCAVAESYLTDGRVSVVCAAMTALMWLDPEKYTAVITALLASEHPGIVRTAAILLRKRQDLDFREIYTIMTLSGNVNTKTKCAKLLFLSGKWKSLIYTLSMLGSGYKETETLCREHINRWLLSVNRSYVELSAIDRQRIKELLAEKSVFLNPDTVNEIMFILK